MVVLGKKVVRDFQNATAIYDENSANVIEAANMDEALVVCREETVDLLIAEFMLRDGFGTDLAKKVREHCPDVPVLLTSGTPLDGWPDAHRKRFDELGFGADFLPKPFYISKLGSKVAHLLPATR